ncbi:MAG: hypothetical protein HC910_02465 [Spirulinaceae cyanobacterium SM2_1_0]|nr:hypothetical protein [Spirulinaceae cyanobacterium SM2_1_0]
MPAVKFRIVAVLAIAALGWLLSWAIAPTALALTPIKLSELGYKPCPPDLATGAVNSRGSARPVQCFLVYGKAENKSGKTVVDADVFGRIYDANGNRLMENRTRLGTLLEVPPGVSDFEIRISVSESQPPPLTLDQFKATGFASRVRPFYYQD